MSHFLRCFCLWSNCDQLFTSDTLHQFVQKVEIKNFSEVVVKCQDCCIWSDIWDFRPSHHNVWNLILNVTFSPPQCNTWYTLGGGVPQAAADCNLWNVILTVAMYLYDYAPDQDVTILRLWHWNMETLVLDTTQTNFYSSSAKPGINIKTKQNFA